MSPHESDQSDEPVTSTETDEEPSASLSDSASPVLVFCAQPGAPAELVAERASNTSMRTTSSRRELAGTVFTIVIFAGAAALGVLGWQAHSGAADARHDAKSASHDRVRLAAQERADDEERGTITAVERDVRSAFADVLYALDTEVDAENRVSGLMNEAVDTLNQGNPASALEMWRTQVDPAIAEEVQAVSVLSAAIDAVDPTVQKLQETFHG